jgi:hypothetical protein
MSSAALFGFTEPPYWMRILAATSVPLFGNDGANEGVAVVEWVRGVVEVFECRLAEVVTTADDPEGWETCRFPGHVAAC